MLSGGVRGDARKRAAFPELAPDTGATLALIFGASRLQGNRVSQIS